MMAYYLTAFITRISFGHCSPCWWFRNPKQPPFGMHKNIQNPVNNGINSTNLNFQPSSFRCFQLVSSLNWWVELIPGFQNHQQPVGTSAYFFDFTAPFPSSFCLEAVGFLATPRKSGLNLWRNPTVNIQGFGSYSLQFTTKIYRNKISNICMMTGRCSEFITHYFWGCFTQYTQSTDIFSVSWDNHPVQTLDYFRSVS